MVVRGIMMGLGLGILDEGPARRIKHSMPQHLAVELAGAIIASWSLRSLAVAVPEQLWYTM